MCEDCSTLSSNCHGMLRLNAEGVELRRIPSVYYTSMDRSVIIKVTLEGKRLREEDREIARS